MTGSLRILAVALLGAVLAGCGGGGGGSGSTSGGPTGGGPQTGTVTLSLSDGVIDDYAHVWMDIAEIRLLSDGGQDILVLDEPVLVDFLALQNFSEVLLRREVVAGNYSKIRLILNSLELEDFDGNVDRVRLNGLRKVDINPRGGFTVRGGDEILIDIDIDLDKSIHVVRAGNSGQIRFRPVIFASIISRFADQKMFRLEGRVDSIDTTAGTFTVCDIRRAFADGVNRPEPADVCVVVDPSDSTPFFDFMANPDLDGIALNDHVVVYGKFPEPDRLVPAVVASGTEFTTLRGLAASEFRAPTRDFDLGASVVDGVCTPDAEPLNVQLAEDAPAFVEYPGTADEAAAADDETLDALSIICRRAEAEGYLVDAVAAPPADAFLRAFILLLGPSQEGVLELAGVLSEKVEVSPDPAVPNDYRLDVEDPDAADPVVVVDDATRVVILTDGTNPDEVVTAEGSIADLPVDPETAQAVVFGVPGEDDVVNATFILLDETGSAP